MQKDETGYAKHNSCECVTNWDIQFTQYRLLYIYLDMICLHRQFCGMLTQGGVIGCGSEDKPCSDRFVAM